MFSVADTDNTESSSRCGMVGARSAIRIGSLSWRSWIGIWDLWSRQFVNSSVATHHSFRLHIPPYPIPPVQFLLLFEVRRKFSHLAKHPVSLNSAEKNQPPFSRVLDYYSICRIQREGLEDCWNGKCCSDHFVGGTIEPAYYVHHNLNAT